jgi:hypothetical protein
MPWVFLLLALMLTGCAESAGLRVVEYRVGETVAGVSVHQTGAANAFAHVHIKYHTERGEIEIIAAPRTEK